ncbi:MAG: hypothetical protein H0V17_17380 [Deltaproteobacteria bacterium]|nr:hypothetical protein [Deltaproteobacteria bacterium]
MRWLFLLLAACGGPDPTGVDPDGPAGSDGPSTDGQNPDGPAAVCSLCTSPGAVENLGTAPNGLVEASGIVASRVHPGVLYAHNDSGDTARVFAFTDTGTAIATLTITGATHEDWEDIAIGPCPAGSCIYIGDIGDNGTNRPVKTIYRFPEPDLTGVSGTVTINNVEEFRFSYPVGLDFFHNAETLLVHPITGTIYVVSKEDVGDPSVVFKSPATLVEGQTATFTKLATLPFPSGNQPDISGGDIDPCGTSVLLRLGSAKLFLLEPTAGGSFDTAFTPSLPLHELPIAAEANGEAISWDATGSGYFTISEGANAQLHRIACP